MMEDIAKILTFSEADEEKKWYSIEIKIPPGMDPRVGHALVNIKSEHKLYMIGGGNYVGETNEIYEINYSNALPVMDHPEEQGKPINKEIACVELADLGLDFPGRYEFLCAKDKAEKRIWIFGGGNMMQTRNDVCYVDLEAQKVVHLPNSEPEDNVPSGRTQGNNSCLIEIQGEEYLAVFGGGEQHDNSVADGNLYLYKTSNNSWTKVEITGSIPFPVQGHGMVSIGTKIYVHGGMDKSDYFGEFYMIDLEPEDKKWTKIEPVGNKPAPRAAHGVCLVGNEMYICGGVGKDKMALPDLWKFNTESMEWTMIDDGTNGVEPLLDMAMTCVELDENKKYILIHGGMEPMEGEPAKIYNVFWIYPI